MSKSLPDHEIMRFVIDEMDLCPRCASSGYMHHILRFIHDWMLIKMKMIGQYTWDGNIFVFRSGFKQPS